jgi:hypothetical protein
MFRPFVKGGYSSAYALLFWAAMYIIFVIMYVVEVLV